MNSPATIGPTQAAERLSAYTVIDVRTPGEYAAGHLPGAHNVPLDHLRTALPALKTAAARGELLMVCASGARSASACEQLAEADIAATTLTGGTAAWIQQGHPADRDTARATWPMERQVRLAAGALVVAGLALGSRYRPARWLSAAVGSGLVFSAATDTCGMAALLAKLPHNQPRATGLDATLDALSR
ncbi:rhodanese-like domain-containing protein [Streptomyces hirsutus]|uniref:Rhodanese-like domain-containing protein n=1 Tax=Streptomyces hirsutus TaxID=35620 RepID=A0ABZ1GPT2_9ACTN|nr:rhodanese-like domain-containing protein [Streptomyces hirsutus]WSD08160.1 rhodanese-like domain-containing protein [Streptomyces hirsutus]WTD18387.1 rhodanese-like domain-containing protein [Streptomyces hirsutus]WTD76687.1 rhodanese-like domain-containing protein [Streptomyces sp. NBC_01635]